MVMACYPCNNILVDSTCQHGIENFHSNIHKLVILFGLCLSVSVIRNLLAE